MTGAEISSFEIVGLSGPSPIYSRDPGQLDVSSQ